MSTWKTADGRTLAWSDIDDRYLWNIVRLLVRRVRQCQRLIEGTAEQLDAHIASSLDAKTLAKWNDADISVRKRTRRDVRRRSRKALKLCLVHLPTAFDEVTRRSLWPTIDDLHVAWDRVCGGDGGPDLSQDNERRPWCLIELWVGFRGVPTYTPEWLASQQQVSP